jgi:hypothetical protein
VGAVRLPVHSLALERLQGISSRQNSLLGFCLLSTVH